MTPMVQIVVTPGSGEGRALATARRLHSALRRCGWQANVQKFENLERLKHWVPESEVKPSHLVCVGGDATLSAAAAAAIRLRVPFVPVPNGFGNIFARAFGHPDRVRAVLELLQHGEVRWVDVGVVNGDELFLSHRSYGVLERIQQKVERGGAQPRKRWQRHLAYYGIARRFIFETPVRPITVEVDGVVACERAILVTVANVETYRGFLSLTPTASPLDGLFDVFAIPRSNRLRLILQLVQIMLRLPGRWHGVVMTRGRCVAVTEKGRPPEELRVRRRVLGLLVPPGAIESLKQRTIEAEADTPLEPPGHQVA